MRCYKPYTWKELIQIRDALQILVDHYACSTKEWKDFDDLLTVVSEEIDYRYKNDRREG